MRKNSSKTKIMKPKLIWRLETWLFPGKSATLTYSNREVWFADATDPNVKCVINHSGFIGTFEVKWTKKKKNSRWLYHCFLPLRWRGVRRQDLKGNKNPVHTTKKKKKREREKKKRCFTGVKNYLNFVFIMRSMPSKYCCNYLVK